MTAIRPDIHERFTRLVARAEQREADDRDRIRRGPPVRHAVLIPPRRSAGRSLRPTVRRQANPRGWGYAVGE